MSRRRRKQRSQLEAIDQINVTPLLDLTFLLLIVFMITMPLMEYGTTVSPPEMNAEQLPQENTRNVTIRLDGALEFDGRVINQNELLEILAELRKTAPDATILLRADSSQSYGEVVDILALIKRSGFVASLVTLPERR